MATHSPRSAKRARLHRTLLQCFLRSSIGHYRRLEPGEEAQVDCTAAPVVDRRQEAEALDVPDRACTAKCLPPNNRTSLLGERVSLLRRRPQADRHRQPESGSCPSRLVRPRTAASPSGTVILPTKPSPHSTRGRSRVQVERTHLRLPAVGNNPLPTRAFMEPPSRSAWCSSALNRARRPSQPSRWSC